MDIETQILRIISNHMNDNWQRVAGVLAGPRREGWFTSEAFVALSEEVNPLEDNGFSVYGEQSLSTILSRSGWPVSAGNSRRIPDLVGYWPRDNEPLAFILEAKLVYIDDRRPQDALTELAEQLDNAHSFVPDIPLIGMVFIASSSKDHDARQGILQVTNLLEKLLPTTQGYEWIGGQAPNILPNLDQASPTWKSYNVYSTLAIGARVRR